MGIKSNLTQESIEAYFAKAHKIMDDEFKRTFAYIGEVCVKKIRSRSQSESWIDQTGNLRSSIGYAVTEYGKQTIKSQFEVLLEGSEGSREGKKFLDSLIGQFKQSYALIVVAGMNYAEFVEARDNKDVLASTELWAKKEMNTYLEKTKKRIYSRISELKL